MSALPSKPTHQLNPWHVRLAPRAPWIVALVVLATIVATQGGPAPVGVFYDDGIYVDLARALAAGHGYRHDALPGTPLGVHYPPLYPFWLFAWSWLQSPLMAINAMGWLKLGNTLLAIAAVVPWALWGTRRLRLDPIVASVATAASLLLVPARAVTSTLFSEPLAWLLLGGALLLVDQETSRATTPRSSTRPVVDLAGNVLTGLLPLARSILLPFAIAAAWRAVRAPGWSIARRVLSVTVCIAPSVAWSLWTRQHAGAIPEAWRGNYGAYTGMWTESWNHPVELIQLCGHQAAALWSTARIVWSGPGAVIALICCLVGLWQLWTASRFAFLGTIGYFVIVLLWPVEPDRFLWGVLPLITLLTTSGAMFTVSLLQRPMLRLAAGALILLPLGACTRLTVAGYRHDGWLAAQWGQANAYAAVVQWARTLPRDAVVLTGNDPLFAMATGLKAAPSLPPDLREGTGAAGIVPPSLRLERSACVVGTGWIVMPDTADATGVALRTLVESKNTRLRLDTPVPVGDTGQAIRFHCIGLSNTTP